MRISVDENASVVVVMVVVIVVIIVVVEQYVVIERYTVEIQMCEARIRRRVGFYRRR